MGRTEEVNVTRELGRQQILRETLIAGLIWLVCAGIFIVIPGCAEEALDENNSANGVNSMLASVDLLPGDDEISGWITVGAYDEASDHESLYVLINGGAEIFIDRGFVSAAFQQYTSCVTGVCGTTLLTLRIYDQGNEANAIAVYDEGAFGIPWGDAGVEARIDERGLASYAVEFWQRSFFVQVIIEEKTDEALNVAKLFAIRVSDEIRYHHGG